MDGLANNTVYLSDDRPLQQSRTCKVDNAKELLSLVSIMFNLSNYHWVYREKAIFNSKIPIKWLHDSWSWSSMG